MKSAKIFLSHRLERLADLLAQELKTHVSALSEPWILLPSVACKQWLSLRLAGQSAIAGLRIMSWREALLKIARSKAPVPDRLELQFALAKILQEDPPAALSWIRQRPQSQRSSLSCLWAGQMCEMGFYGLKEAQEWQKELWEKMEKRWRMPASLLGEIGSAPEIHCFCIDELPPPCLQFLLKVQASFYNFSPCKMFWEDLCSDRERSALEKHWTGTSLDALDALLTDTHPLLANWGKLGRSSLKQLSQNEAEIIESYEGSAEDLLAAEEAFSQGKVSLLQMLQQDLLLLRTPEGRKIAAQTDRSIQLVGAGSSKLREVQILREHLLEAIEQGALPSEILVLAPDIRAYEQIVHFVLGQELPYRIAQVAQLPHNRFLQGLLRFFALAEGRWEADGVLELLENRAFRKKQQLSDQDVAQFRLWIEEAKIRDGQEQWEEGIRRMVLGLVFLLPEDAGPPRIQSIDWGLADPLERFLQILALLQQQAKKFHTQQSATLQHWQERIQECAELLFEAEECEKTSLIDFLQKIPTCFEGELFPFCLLLAALKEECERKVDSFQAHLLETIEFASLQSGAVRPARCLFVLGMENGSFPRSANASSLDWKGVQQESADRDRYLFLQLFFAARERLYISFCHLAPDDGKSVEPSLLIQELQQCVELFYEGASLPIAIHPTLPYHPRYFNGELKSYSQQAYRAAKTGKGMQAPFWPKLERERKEILQWEDLDQIARHPWKFLLRRMGVYLKEEQLFSEKRMQEEALTPYRQKTLLKKTLKKPIDQVLKEHAHELPKGAFGELARVQLLQKESEWKSHLHKWGVAKESIERLSIDCKVGGVEIQGAIEGMAGDCFVTTDDNKFGDFVRNWPALLLTQMKTGTEIFYCSLKAGTKKKVISLDPGRALEQWIEYQFLAQEQLSPLIWPWCEPFLRKDKEEWLKVAQKSDWEQEAVTKWVLDKQPPLETMWQFWSNRVKRTFSDLIGGASEDV